MSELIIREKIELIDSMCNRCIFRIEGACRDNCTVKVQIGNLFEKIEKLEKENKSCVSKAKFWESEANAYKYEEYV